MALTLLDFSMPKAWSNVNYYNSAGYVVIDGATLYKFVVPKGNYATLAEFVRPARPHCVAQDGKREINRYRANYRLLRVPKSGAQ